MNHFASLLKRCSIIVLLVTSLGQGAIAQSQPETVQALVRFHHQKPSLFVIALTETEPQKRKPTVASSNSSEILNVTPILQHPVTFLSQISLMVPDDIESSLTVSGTKEAVSKVKALVNLFDVAAKPVQLRLRLRKQMGSANEKSNLIASAALKTDNDRISRITLLAEGHPFHFEIVPHRGGDGSYIISVDMSFENQPYSGTESNKLGAIRQTRCISTLFLADAGKKKVKGVPITQSSPDNSTTIGPYTLEIIPLVTESPETQKPLPMLKKKSAATATVHLPNNTHQG